MKKAFSLSEFKDLTIDERIELVENLWDIIAEVPETIDGSKCMGSNLTQLLIKIKFIPY